MAEPTSSTDSSPPDDEKPAPASLSKYRLRVTAGPSYEASTHFLVPVNAPTSHTIETSHMTLVLAIRIRNFTGLPDGSPSSNPYFDHHLHTWDQYSIAFSFIPKVDIPSDELVFGNDFDRPIRDRLPPGFGQAFKIVKWWVDPGLEGDVYADNPWLFGKAVSSWNYLRVGEKVFATSDEDEGAEKEKEKEGEVKWEVPFSSTFHETIVEEGGDGDGVELRDEIGVPSDSAGRKKWFLTKENREKFTFEKGRLYQSDFGNPYLDFNDFSLKLPGFSLNVVKYIDEGTHELRYVLKNFVSGEVYAVVMFTLLWGEELDEEKRKERDDHEEKNKGVDSTSTSSHNQRYNNEDSEDDDAAFEDADSIPGGDDDID